jgi:hypothetical protein
MKSSPSHQNPYIQPPQTRKSLCLQFGMVTTAAAMALLTCPYRADAQSDNFDSYSTPAQMQAAGWILSSLNPALVTTTFPAVGSGKGLRIQANPVPSTAPAVGMWYRTNDYTDFYVAIDLANWPGTDKNQAFVMFGRMTDGTTGTVVPNLNPANAQGIICNYDTSQAGENPTDRRQGELQMNIVAPGFATLTLAAAEITLVPGRSYRITFQGVGIRFTAKVYDATDLTKPLVSLETEDATYGNGACGLLGFSRQGTTGTVDLTADNYFAGAADPNVAPSPALAHPIAGTPQVVTRNPTNRFTNFHAATNEISFTARTFTTNEIDASATKLYLNGLDVSASLAPLPANGSTASFAAAAGTLTENTVYAGRIEVQDTSGTLKSTNTFWFDTFSDAYLTNAIVKTIEVEDYNYSNGVYQLDPIPVSGVDTNLQQTNGIGLGGGYFGLEGVPDVDYYKPGGHYSVAFAEYRSPDRVQITQGSWYFNGSDDEAGDITDILHPFDTRIHDTQRAKYAALGVYEYQVRLTSPDDWMNYTRSFANTNYLVYLRCGSFGATEAHLDRITGDPTTTNQTPTRLGTFRVSNHIMRLNYRYEPLMAGASPVVVRLGGTNTLRLTMGGTVGQDARKVSMDYLLFVPTAQGPTIFDNFNDANDTANPPWDHYDPIGGLTAAPASFLLTNGGYRIYSPAPASPAAGPARAGSFLRDAHYTDFYVAVDVLDFDDTVRQAFGIAARINTPGLQTTGGYLFSWEPGSGTLPGTNNGDLDISALIDETPVGQLETNSSGLHLERGKSYRFVFMGKGFDFEGQVYELPDLYNPLIRLFATDLNALYPSGRVGLITASQGSTSVPGDATFDNFLATTAEPRLSVTSSPGLVRLSWPLIPYRLESSPSLTTPVWTTVATGISQVGEENVYTVPTTSSAFFRLIYP